MASGRNRRARATPVSPRCGDDALEAALAGQPEQDPGEARVVLHDQQDPVVRLDRLAVVRDVGRLVHDADAAWRAHRRGARRPPGVATATPPSLLVATLSDRWLAARDPVADGAALVSRALRPARGSSLVAGGQVRPPVPPDDRCRCGAARTRPGGRA